MNKKLRLAPFLLLFVGLAVRANVVSLPDYCAAEFAKIAGNLEKINRSFVSGELDAHERDILLAMTANAKASVVLSCHGPEASDPGWTFRSWSADYCHVESGKLAQSDEEVRANAQNGKITEREKSLLLRMSESARRSLALTCTALEVR